ncbi:shikimate kinase [Alienimonas chondri]|uniref:Shikimate kinase n=1 Tax=Alienimonas chondri TaxID=2681879 RepID=A0ABX1V8N8_9PLAN|nr:shikimate kinase [Alienimonas chondri]NNJ24505.1 Shikimate kinase 2 [Alienimonas chondri]
MTDSNGDRPSVVSLVGARGSGKSTIGRMVAEELGRNFADADEEIVRVSGRSIPEFFETHCEVAFRLLEAEVIKALLERDDLVLATGGGAVLMEETRQRLAAAGPVIYLQADAATLHARVGSDPNRPPLTDLPAAEEMAAVLNAREAFYRDASTVVVDATLPPAEVVRIVRSALS